MKKLFVFLAAAAMTIASAAETHRVKLFQESIFNGTTLAAGDYRLTIDGDKATIGKGKTSVEAPVVVETADSKYSSTSVRYQNGDGKYRVREIHIGGTAKKLVFNN